MNASYSTIRKVFGWIFLNSKFLGDFILFLEAYASDILWKYREAIKI